MPVSSRPFHLPHLVMNKREWLFHYIINLGTTNLSHPQSTHQWQL